MNSEKGCQQGASGRRWRDVFLFRSISSLFRISSFGFRVSWLAGVLGLSLLLPVQADLVLVQKVDGAGQSGEQTIRIKDGKSRADIAQALSIITDKTTGDAFTLKHGERTFMKIPAAQSQAMLEELRKKRGDAPAPELKSTGKKEKVGEYQCEVFKCDLGGLSVTYWIAREFPNYATIQTQLAAVQGSPLALSQQGLMPDPGSFPGMTMKTELILSGKKVTTTTVSVKETPVPASTFDVPAGYKETPSPELQFVPR